MSASKKIEVPIKVKEARQQLGCGETYMSQLLKAMGKPGVRRVFLSEVLKWLKNNPGWVSTRRSAT